MSQPPDKDPFDPGLMDDAVLSTLAVLCMGLSRVLFLMGDKQASLTIHKRSELLKALGIERMKRDQKKMEGNGNT